MEVLSNVNLQTTNLPISSSTPRQLLIKASTQNYTELVSWFGTYVSSKESGIDLSVLLTTFDTNNATKLFTNLAKHASVAFDSILHHIGQENITDNNNNNQGGGNGTTSMDSEESSLYLPLSTASVLLKEITNLCFVYAEEKSRPLPRSYMELAQLLHNCMYSILGYYQSMGPVSEQTMIIVVQLCERLYITRKDAATSLVPLLIIYLMIQVNNPLEKGETTLKRLIAISSAFKEFDYDDDNSDSLKECMLRAFTSPKLLNSTKGRQLLGTFMTVSPTMTTVCHNAIKAQFPISSKLQDWYGMVYVKAWEETDPTKSFGSNGTTTATATNRNKFEETCLQDLLHRGIHAANPDTFQACRKIFSHFLQARDKKMKGVDTSIFRVYTPILYRALECNNANVRRNAATIFHDTFPIGLLECPGGAPERDNLIAKQLGIVCRLSDDDCPTIREIAISFMGMILDKYWETLPSSLRINLLNRIVHRAQDTVSASIRICALRTIADLIDTQPYCHEDILNQGILPSLVLLIDDRIEKVRIAAVYLLQAIDKNHGFLGSPLGKFIPVDNVMARLVLDAANPAIAEGIVKLLTKSYFPSTDVREKSGEKVNSLPGFAAGRILEGLKAWELATLTFLAYVPRFPDLVSKKVLVDTIRKLQKGVHRVADECVALYAPETNDSTVTTTTTTSKKGGKTGASTVVVTAKESNNSARTKRSRDGEEKTVDTLPLKLAEHASRLKVVAPVLRAIATLWNGIESTVKKNNNNNTVSSKPSVSNDVDAETGGISHLMDEDISIQNTLVSIFGGNEIGFLLKSLTTGINLPTDDESTDGISPPSLTTLLTVIPGAHVHLAAVTSSLLSIASHLPLDKVMDLPSSLWDRLIHMSSTELMATNDTNNPLSAILPGIIKCLCNWGKGMEILTIASKTLKNIANTIMEMNNMKNENDDEFTSVVNNEYVFLSRSDVTMNPLVAAAAIEQTMVFVSNIPSTTNTNDLTDVSTSFTVDILRTIEPASGVMSSLAWILLQMGNVISSGPHRLASSSSYIAKLLSELSPICVRVWSRITILQLQARVDVVGSDIESFANRHIGEISEWALQMFLPIVLSAQRFLDTTNDAEDESGSSSSSHKMLRTLLATANSIFTSLVTLSSDLLMAGIAHENIYNLYQSLTRTMMIDLPLLPYLNITTKDTLSTVSPIDWCTSVDTFMMKENMNDNTNISRLHIALLRLGLRLYSGVNGNIVTIVSTTDNSEKVVPLTFSSHARAYIASSLTNLLCNGILSPTNGTTATQANETATIANECIKQIFNESKKLMERGGEKPATNALTILFQQLIPALENCLPDTTLTNLAQGHAVTFPDSLGSNTLSTLLSSCTSTTGNQWINKVLMDYLTQRVALLHTSSSTSISTTLTTKTKSKMNELTIDQPVLRTLALISALAHACVGPGLNSSLRTVLSECIKAHHLDETSTGKCILGDLAIQSTTTQ